METQIDAPPCIICFEPMVGENQCCVFPSCGHSICKICSEKVEKCPSCKRPGRPSPTSIIDEIKDEGDLVCQLCEVWFGEDIFYPVFFDRGNDIICNICSMKNETSKTKHVKFFSLAQFSSQMKMATQRKLDSCPHSIENHVYCLSHHVHFCKLCCSNSFSAHKSHRLLFGDDIRKEERELDEIMCLLEKQEKEGIIGFLYEFSRFVKVIVTKASKSLSKPEKKIFESLNLQKDPLYEDAIRFSQKFQNFRLNFEKVVFSSGKAFRLAHLKYLKERLFGLLVKSNSAFISKGKLHSKLRQFSQNIVGLYDRVYLSKFLISSLTEEYLTICERPITHFVKNFLTPVKPMKFKKGASRPLVNQPFGKVSWSVPEVDRPRPIEINVDEEAFEFVDLSDDSC